MHIFIIPSKYLTFSHVTLIFTLLAAYMASEYLLYGVHASQILFRSPLWPPSSLNNRKRRPLWRPNPNIPKFLIRLAEQTLPISLLPFACVEETQHGHIEKPIRSISHERTAQLHPKKPPPKIQKDKLT